MGDKRPGLDRRQVLKYVMMGGVATAVMMPNKWVKPVVNAVIPPAHAAASAPATTQVGTTVKGATGTLSPTAACQASLNVPSWNNANTVGVVNPNGGYNCTNGTNTWSTN
jgi:hypothetical protein